jgi:hypothetical protein
VRSNQGDQSQYGRRHQQRPKPGPGFTGLNVLDDRPVRQRQEDGENRESDAENCYGAVGYLSVDSQPLLGIGGGEQDRPIMQS